MIVTPSADVELALRAIVFGGRHGGPALHHAAPADRAESIAPVLLPRVAAALASLRVGHPLEEATLVGPLIDEAALDAHRVALAQAQAEGGVVHGGETVAVPGCPDGCYVRRRWSRCRQSALVCRETFSPILYAMRYRRLR
jgi:aldehyde dehydrogenase (NAD+)